MAAGSTARSKVVGAVKFRWEPSGTEAPAWAGPWATLVMLERDNPSKVRLAVVRKALLVFRERSCSAPMQIKFYSLLKI